jgi:F-type H+-transporting ATPase subunit delta
MAENATVARPYAEAAFALADETRALSRWAEALAAMARVAAHPELHAWMAHPRLTSRQAYDLFLSLCPEDLPTEVRSFVRLLIANDRVSLLAEIREQFMELKNRREGVVEAEIRTAFRLDNAQISALVADLERRFKRRVQPRVAIDKELIGGVRIVVGDEVIDGSVRGKLEEMAAALRS